MEKREFVAIRGPVANPIELIKVTLADGYTVLWQVLAEGDLREFKSYTVALEIMILILDRVWNAELVNLANS